MYGLTTRSTHTAVRLTAFNDTVCFLSFVIVPAPTRSVTPDATARGASPRVDIVRPAGLPRAVVPGTVPAPEHHHLPSWVRRTYGLAKPVLSDLLAALDVDSAQQLQEELTALTAQISSGKFSVAWRYPDVISRWGAVFQSQRQSTVEADRANRATEMIRHRLLESLRVEGGKTAPDVVSRLTKAVQSAGSTEALQAVEREVKMTLRSARTIEAKRREREIDRTKAQIQRTARTASTPAAAGESWQDVLRRFSEEQLVGASSDQ